MSNDYTSQIIQWIMDQAGAGQITTPGAYEGKPSGLTAEMARRMNLGQDWLTVQADSSNAALAGANAYSPEAFQGTSSYTPVDPPGSQQLRAYAQRTNTPEGVTANGILQGPTAQAEIAKLQAAYTEAEKNGTLADDPILSQIPMGQPSDYDGSILPDWGGLQAHMGTVEDAYMSESQATGSGALYDPDTGEYLGGGNRRTVLDANGNPVLTDVETTPSESAQWYIDQGLSPPDQQYTAADLMDPSWQGQDEYAQQAMSNFYNSSDALNALYDQLRAEEPTYKTENAAAATPFGKPGDAVAAAAAPVTEDSNGFSDFWENAQPGSFADRLKGVGAVAGPAAEEVGSWFQSLFKDTAAGPQTVTGTTGTDLYGLPTTSSTGGGFESIPADVGQAGLTDINAVVGPNSVTAQGIDNWLSGLWAGAQSAASGDWLGAISDASGNALDRITGGHSIQDQLDNMSPEEIAAIVGGNQAGGQQYSAGGSADPWAGMTLEQQQAAVQANPVMQTPAWQSILQQSMQQAIQGTGDPGVGGGGAGGSPSVRTTADLAGAPDATQPGVPPGGTVHNGAIFDAMGRLVGYTPGAGQIQPQTLPPLNTNDLSAIFAPSTPAPNDPATRNTNTLTGYPVGASGIENANVSTAEPSGGYTHNGAIFDAQGRLLGYTPESQRTGPEPSEAAGVTPYPMHVTANGITGGPTVMPKPDRQTPSPDAVQAMLQSLFGIGPQEDVTDRNISVTPYPMNVTANGISGGPTVTRDTTGSGSSPNQSDQAGRGTQSVPRGGYVHNGAIFDSHDRLVGYEDASIPTTPSWWSQIGGDTQRRVADSSSASIPTTPSWWQRIRGDEQGDQQVRIGSGNKRSAGGKQLKNSRAVSTTVRGFKPNNRPYDTEATRAGNAEFWRQSRAAGQAANRAYGADYGRAAAIALLLQQRGITPTSTQLSARRSAAASNMGL